MGTYLTLDDRSLGAGRIALAAVLLFDLARRIPGLATWYTNDGLLPNHTLLWQPAYDHALSLFYIASRAPEAALGFVLCGAAYAMLLVGWRTRLAQGLSLVAVLSLHGRVLFVQNGGDVVLGEFCLWTLFLPTGRRFSLDALRLARAPRSPGGAVAAASAASAASAADHEVTSLACLAILLQLAAIYFFNGIQKSGPAWTNGSAVHYALYADGQATQLAVWLRPHLTLGVSQILTRAAVSIELAAPLLILVPFATSWARLIAVTLLLGLHAGFALFLNLGVFSPAMIACLPNLLPARFWSATGRLRFATALTRTTLRLWDRLAPRVARLVCILGVLLALPGREPDRYPGMTGARSIERTGKRTVAFLREATVLVLILIAGTQLGVENPAMPARLRSIQPHWAHVAVNGLQLLEGWTMFAPEPPLGDRTVIVDAVTSDGRHVDPLNEAARGRARPPFTAATIPAGLGYDVFFGTYLDRIPDFDAYHRALMEWIVRYPERTGRPGDVLASFEVLLVENDSPPPGALVSSNPRTTILFRFPQFPQSRIER